jgi:putative oxidoreductase
MFLQRLFSTFADGWPGLGLLLLRVVAAVFLGHDAWAALARGTHLERELVRVIAAGAGILLIVGLWTPIAGVLAALLEVWIALSRPEELWTSTLVAAIASGLAMLGPGACSVDARRFGRKRISIQDR